MEKIIVEKMLQLEGLTCTNCQISIENEIKKMDGVIEAEVCFATEVLAVTYDEDKINLEDIIQTIEKMDYVVKNDIVINGEAKKNASGQFAVIGIIILGMYLVIKNTIGFNFIPEINSNMGYAVLFAVGLLSSLHCVAMCGGINLSLCVAYKFEEGDNELFSKLTPSFMYNIGRVISYTAVGGLVGALGSVFTISNTGSAFVSMLAGVFMVIMGLNMLNIFPWLRKINPHMPKIFVGKINSDKKSKGPFVVGLLNGLMPCGPLQAMQLYALGTGSFIAGAMSMFAFSLGTVPLLFAFGALGSMLSSKFTKNMIKVSAMLVIVLGFVMVNRGFAFTGITISNPVATANTKGEGGNISTINGDIQEIATTLSSGRYTPITIQAGTQVKWTINADKDSLNGCNNEIIIPEYSIKQKLVPGENVISFTPNNTGEFGYSCWMGMIRSSITVVEDIQGTDLQRIENNIDNTGIPLGCCGV